MTTPSTTTETTTAPTTSAGNKCTAADLEPSMTSPSAGAGNRYADLVVTNTSGRTCTLHGYGGLQLIGADGKPASTGARVIPPDDTKAFTVTFAFGSVCAGGHVDGSAYFKK